MWPFSRKQNTNAAIERYLRAMFQNNITSGVGLPIQDKSESYVNEGYAGNTDVYSLIRKIDSMSKQGEIKLMQKNKDGTSEEVTGHPLNDFLYRINDSMSFEMFRSASHIYKLTVGNNYWYKPIIDTGVNKGKTTEIHLMPAQFTEVVQGSWLNPVKGYQLNFDPTIELAKDEVMHQKFFDPRFDQTFFMYGLSPIKAAAQTVAKLNQAEITEQRSFENSSPPYILYKKGMGNMTYEGLTSEQKQDLQKELRQYAKDAKRGKPLVTKFEPEIIKLGVSPVDLGVLDSSVDGMRRLCNVYQFPSVLMNDTANSTYNNIVEARKAAWTDCIIPLNKEFAADLTYFLTNGIDDYKDFYFKFDYSEVEELQTGIKSRVEWMRLAGWSKNEIRQATGRITIDVPVMDEPIFTQGEIPLSDMTFQETEGKDFIDYESGNQEI